MKRKKRKRKEREKRRREEEEEERKNKRRREVQEVRYEILLWKSCWNISFEMFGTYMLGNTCLSWVRKTLTHQYMYILVGLS